ncbi:unnamed protein product [Sphagnum balticum]
MAYHLFVAIAYITPLIGSILADDYYGRFKVILYVSLVYVLGHVSLSMGAVPQWPTAVRNTLDIVGLATIAFATGVLPSLRHQNINRRHQTVCVRLRRRSIPSAHVP